MFSSQCCKLFAGWTEFGRVRFPGQYGSSDDPASVGFNETPQVGQGSALPNEIIHQQVIGTDNHFPRKKRLPGEPGKTIGARMPDHIDLNDGCIDRKAGSLRQFIGQCFGDGIDSGAFKGVG